MRTSGWGGLSTGVFVLALTQAAGAPIIVYLADGSSLPLQSWSFSYEYVSWPRGGDAAYAEVARHQASTLWLGKRQVSVAGAVLEVPKEGDPRDRLAVVRAPGQRERLKAEAPGREVVAPQVGKDRVVLVRSLDLWGESLTGTKRQFCLLSFSMLVECGGGPDQRVVRVEFPGKE